MSDQENEYIEELLTITKKDLAERITNDLQYRSFIMREDWHKVYQAIRLMLPKKIYVVKTEKKSKDS